MKEALKAIRALDLGSCLEAYCDRAGLDREVYPEEHRKRLPTFLVHGEFYEDPVIIVPHLRKLSAVHLAEYRRERSSQVETRLDPGGG